MVKPATTADRLLRPPANLLHRSKLAKQVLLLKTHTHIQVHSRLWHSSNNLRRRSASRLAQLHCRQRSHIRQCKSC